MKKSRNSEFVSYVFIRNELEKLGWNIKNPSRSPEGQVYTQQECLDNKLIGPYLKPQRPEYVIKVKENMFWIIEAKGTHAQLEQAYKEAIEYALCINANPDACAFIVSGVAGNDIDRYLIKTGVIIGENAKPVLYNSKEITGLLSPIQAKYLCDNRTHELNELIEDEEILLDIAEEINAELHAASINKDNRAAVIASVLLAMLSNTLPDFDASPDIFIKDVNNRAEDKLIEHSKRDFAEQIELKLPNEKSAKYKYKEAIVKVFFLLRKINVQAALNSSNDVLGKFYEVFLKYGNGAKDIGIVLTPRHITTFASEVLEVNGQDIIYDPACGTGGFLVAAYDRVKANNPDLITEFKKHKIFGTELQANIAILAIVNMIFRGDGKNNIINDSCFAKNLQRKVRNGDLSAEYIEEENDRPPVTKTLMNPPFALKKSDEKEHVFIDHALKQMVEGGLLFAIVPTSIMFASDNIFWRKSLLKNHTLVSVIKFPNELFYPQASVETVGIIIRSKVPHDMEKDVLWIKMDKDGYKKWKRRRVYCPNSEIPIIEENVKEFIQTNKIKEQMVEFIETKPIDKEDDKLDLIPQNYLGTRVHTIEEINHSLKERYFDLLNEKIKEEIR